MKKVEKSSSAGTEVESSTNVDGLQVSQPIAKHNVIRSCYVVEFKNGDKTFWLAPWEGDPGRTLLIENATKFQYSIDAEIELSNAVSRNKHRNLNGEVVRYNF